MKKKSIANRVIVAVLCIVMVLSFTACGGNGGEGGGSTGFKDGYGDNVLRICNSEDYESGDPQMTTADYLIPLNIFDTPVNVVPTTDGGTEIVPALAERWEISSDGKTYTLYIRKGVKFTNGEELKADDFLYTIDRMFQPDRNTVNTSAMDMIAGTQDMLDGKINTLEGVGVEVVDDYTVKINLVSAYAPFLSVMSVPGWSIYNRKAGDEADEAGGGKSTSYLGNKPEYTAGTGPFKLAEWELNDHVYLEANKDYWRGAPKIDGILIKIVSDSDTMKMMYENGELDIFDLTSYARDLIDGYSKSDKYKDQILEKTIMGVFYYAINESIEPFQDVRVRKALQMAIDRQTILDSLYGGIGEVAHGLFAPGMWVYNKDIPKIEYNPEKAKELLTEAGYADGFEMELTQMADSRDSLAINEVIQDQLSKVGITATIKQMDEATWYDIRRKGELGMYTTNWTADFDDPDNFIYTFFSSAATKARSFNYTNQEAIKSIEEERYDQDHEARLKKYQELELTVMQEDAAMIPLFHLKKVRLVQPRVKGFIPHYAGYGDCNYYSVSIEAPSEGQ